MFKPERMSLINLIFFKEDLEKVNYLIMDSACMEVESTEKFISPRSGLDRVKSNQLVQTTKEVLSKIEVLMQDLNIRKEKILKSELKLSPDLLDEIKEKSLELETEIRSILQQKQRYEQEIELLDYKSRFLSQLEDMGFSPAQLSDLPHLYLKAGIVDYGNLKKLLQILEQSKIRFVYKRGGYFKGKVFFFISCFKEEASRLDSALKGLSFQNIDISAPDKELAEVLEETEMQIWTLREAVAESILELKRFREEDGRNLNRFYWLLTNNLKIYQAMENFMQSEYSYLISFWIPSAQINKFKKKLQQSLGKRFEIFEEKAEGLIREKKVSYDEVPSFLKHPALLRPFQKILSLYGWPAYLHIDPTLFMAVSFILMFGMMFADLGHGLILTLIGILLYLQRKYQALKDAAVILFYSGMSSSLFGILFGSVFGKENLIKAVWFSPFQQPLKFLMLGIILGTVLISLGIILNILQYFWQRKLKEVLFSQWGFISLAFYWISLYILVSGLRFNMIRFSLLQLSLILGLPLLLVTLGDVLFSKKEENRDLTETIVKPMEIMLGLLTNTISYVRVAAFGLTHMALMTSVYLVAETMGGIVTLKESVVIEGNIGVILLEGLIVFIQCLRLEYYEFFSKFFLLQGRRFNPLKIEN